jgi:hypothetical protein
LKSFETTEIDSRALETFRPVDIDSKEIEIFGPMDLDSKPLERVGRSDVDSMQVDSFGHADVDSRPVDSFSPTNVDSRPVDGPGHTEVDSRPLVGRTTVESKAFESLDSSGIDSNGLESFGPSHIDSRHLDRFDPSAADPSLQADPRRFEDVEVDVPAEAAAKPSPVEPVRSASPLVESGADDAPADPVPPVPAGLVDAPARRDPDTSRSAIWPLSLALVVGLALGFASGYGVGSHDRSSPATVVLPLQAPLQAAADIATAGRGPQARSDDVNLERGVPPKDSTPRSTAAASTGAVSTPASRSGSRNAALGQLIVRSTPAGARVFVDGRDAGRTPATVRDLAVGAHRVRVARDGYLPSERRVALTGGRPSSLVDVRLSRAPAAAATARAATRSATPGTAGRFAGSLSVESRPAGARVFVDGRLMGTTPVRLPDVGAGEHAIRLERDGYQRWTSSVRVVANERNRVTASLEK